MSKPCVKCGRQTNNIDEICAPCAMDEHINGTVNNKEITMTKVADSKICVDCKQPYRPTSNVQQRCTGCKAERKKGQDADRRLRIKKEASAKAEGPIKPQAIFTVNTAAGIREKLIMKKSDLEQELAKIEAALEVIAGL